MAETLLRRLEALLEEASDDQAQSALQQVSHQMQPLHTPEKAAKLHALSLPEAGSAAAAAPAEGSACHDLLRMRCYEVG